MQKRVLHKGDIRRPKWLFIHYQVFAPGNLRATADHPAYKRLFDYWVDNRY